MALGISLERIQRSVVREALQLTGIGLLVGFALSIGAGLAFSRVLAGITPTDPGTYAAVSAGRLAPHRNVGVVSRHGGVENRDAGRRAQQECTSALLRTIGSTHAVTEADERLGWLVAALLGSFLVPMLVVAAGGAWAVLVEIVQVGNEHLAHRARAESLRGNLLVMFGVGVAAVWIGGARAALQKRAEVDPAEAESVR